MSMQKDCLDISLEKLLQSLKNVRQKQCLNIFLAASTAITVNVRAVRVIKYLPGSQYCSHFNC